MSPTEQIVALTRKGWRFHGRRKERLMLQAQLLLIDLQLAGVHIPTLQKLVGLDRPVYDIPTKEWSGIIGQLKSFKRENNL
jgi:hypothetical protein